MKEKKEQNTEEKRREQSMPLGKKYGKHVIGYSKHDVVSSAAGHRRDQEVEVEPAHVQQQHQYSRLRAHTRYDVVWYRY